jgi:hypothetical protein
VRYADAPLILAYRLTYVAHLSVGLFAVVRRCTRYARFTAAPAVALGLRLCDGGGAVGLVYAGHEAAYALLRRPGAGYRLVGLVDSGRQRNVLIVAALAPLRAGSTLPAWGERAGLAAAAGHHRGNRIGEWPATAVARPVRKRIRMGPLRRAARSGKPPSRRRRSETAAPGGGGVPAAVVGPL